MVIPWGISTSPLQRQGSPESLCPTPQQDNFSTFAEWGLQNFIINIKHSHGWKVLLVKALHDIMSTFLVEDDKIQTFFLMKSSEHF